MKTRDSGIKSTLAIYIALIVILTVCTFAIPYNKISNGVLVSVYVCSVVMLVVEEVLTITLLFKEEKANQKILGLPILYSGFVTIIFQLLFTIVIYIANAYVEVPMWVVAVVESLLFCILVIQLAKGFFFKNRNAEYHEVAANTKFMDEFRARLKAISIINTNENIKKELEDLVDIARGSDPITNDKTLDSESELLSILQELDQVIKNGSEDEARTVITKMKNTLIERNVLCKAGK